MRRLCLAAWAAAAAALAAWPGAAISQEAQPLSACIAALRKDLRAHPEVSAQTFDTYTREVQDLRPVPAVCAIGRPRDGT